MRTFAPLSRTPNRIDAWFSSSEMTRHPLFTNAGMNVELVAKPIELINESSMPRNLATSDSHMTCKSLVPPSRRAPPVETP